MSKKLLKKMQDADEEVDIRKVVSDLLVTGDMSYMGTAQVVAKAVDSQRSGHYLKQT